MKTLYVYIEGLVAEHVCLNLPEKQRNNVCIIKSSRMYDWLFDDNQLWQPVVLTKRGNVCPC